MTVRELIDLLEQQPDKGAPVVLRDGVEQRSFVPFRVVGGYDWREPGVYLTFIDY